MLLGPHFHRKGSSSSSGSGSDGAVFWRRHRPLFAACVLLLLLHRIAVGHHRKGDRLPSQRSAAHNQAMNSSSGDSGGSSRAHEARAPMGDTVPGDPQPDSIVALPADFDAETYLAYHPDLAQAGVTTAEQARQHYMRHGWRQGRLHRRLRGILRYTACTGLINQHYSHIAAFTLASSLGLDVVLPPAACRDSFGHYFSSSKQYNQVTWSPAPIETLLDVEALTAFWKQRGLVVHAPPGLHPFPDLSQPADAFMDYPVAALGLPNNTLVVRLDGVYTAARDLPELVDWARASLVREAARVVWQDPKADLRYVLLDLPCSFFSLRTLSVLPTVAGVARSLRFAPDLHAMAERILDQLTEGGTRPFNGLHLRVEADARDWMYIMGGPQAIWRGYLHAMSRAGFNRTTPVYVASGILTYGASAEMDSAKYLLVQTEACSCVHHKEQYIPQAELDALHSEQKALLDFLVLARARQFVGFGASTFSFYLREYRALQGMSRTTSAMVDASRIGTDALFYTAGTVV